jgi:hypothetical protein
VRLGKISPFPYVILDIGFGDNIVIPAIIVVVFIFGILISLIGDAFALRRRTRGLALIGSVGALTCVPLFGIVAIILLVISKRSFVKKSILECKMVQKKFRLSAKVSSDNPSPVKTVLERLIENKGIVKKTD